MPPVTKTTSPHGTRGTHSARIVQTVPYIDALAGPTRIPVGPCLVEQIDPFLVSIVWGQGGQSSVALPLDEALAAADCGHLVLLD